MSAQMVEGTAPSPETVGRAQAAPLSTATDVAELLEEAQPRLLALAYSVLRDRGLASDAVQDTMERALRAWSTLRSPASSGAWLAKICLRQSSRLRRKELLRSWLRLPRDGVSAELLAADIDLERAIAKLPPRQRAILALHYLYGFSLDESAGVLGVRPGTARSHLARALNTLRQELQQ
jgi:RNA polymerase sigma-70 factor, ECF subfamily